METNAPFHKRIQHLIVYNLCPFLPKKLRGLDIGEIGDDTEVAVVFSGVGLKKLLLSFARLEKIE